MSLLALVDTLAGVRLQSRVEAQPSEYQQRLATNMVEAIVHVLGIREPRIRFYHRAPLDTMNAYASPADNEICVAADLSDVDLLRAIAHEGRHLWHYSQRLWLNQGEEARERDARLFALSWPMTADDMPAFRKLYGSRGKPKQSLELNAKQRSTHPELNPGVYPGMYPAINAKPKVKQHSYDPSREWSRNRPLNPARFEDPEWRAAADHARQWFASRKA